MQEAASAEAAAIDRALDPARALGREGRLPEMEQACRGVIGAFPGSAHAWRKVGTLMAAHGNAALALACMEQAIQIAPDAPAARLDLGNLLLDLGRPADALPHFEQVTARNRNHAQAWYGLGRARFALQQGAAAAAALERCTALAPADVAARVLLARARLSLNDFAGALRHAHDALGIEADSIDAITVVVEALLLDERRTEAESCLRDRLQKQPDCAPLQYLLSRFLLEQGDYRAGFALYEARLRVPSMQRYIEDLALPMPMWRGEDLHRRRLLVITEQGYGDHIQFYRFIERLRAAGAEVVLATSPPLRALMLGQPGCAGVVTAMEDARASGCDYYAFIGSLPHRLGIQADAITPSAPYLRADAAKREAWRTRLAQLSPGRRVGLVWAGRPEHRNDSRRSLPLSKLAPLAAVRDVTWIGVQAGPRAAEADAPDSALRVVRFGLDVLGDFDDSAALIAELDLLISVDTAPAHLAGALGRPVWLLLPKVADWRWSLAEETSPWYPGMRLFRQHTRDDWDEVVRAVAAAL